MLSLRRALASLALASATASCAKHAPPPAPPPEPAMAVAPKGPSVPRGHLARAEVDRVLVTQGVPWLLGQVMSEPAFGSDGKFSGWRMVGLPEDWRDIDLLPGDIVMRVNGLPLEKPEQAFEAWKSVAKLPALTLTLMRDGATRQVAIPIDGPISPETANALAGDAGPRRAPPAPERRGVTLGGGTLEPDQDAY
jgi:hypothetical protein